MEPSFIDNLVERVPKRKHLAKQQDAKEIKSQIDNRFY